MIVEQGQSNQYTALSNTSQHWQEPETGGTYKIVLPVNLVYSVSHMWADFLGEEGTHPQFFLTPFGKCCSTSL